MDMATDSEQLVRDIRAVVADAEEMLRETAGKTGKEISELQSSMATRLAVAKDKLVAAEEAMVDKAKQVAKVADTYVHDNPWQSAIIAGGIGFIVGYLTSRRN
jgi:ElaB/YqjD/DUF883 family membrane-anchored ribosome-binding protein